MRLKLLSPRTRAPDVSVSHRTIERQMWAKAIGQWTVDERDCKEQTVRADDQNLRGAFPKDICYFRCKDFFASFLLPWEWFRNCYAQGKMLWERHIVTIIYILRKEHCDDNDCFCKISWTVMSNVTKIKIRS